MPYRHCLWVRWSSQVPEVCWGHGVWDAAPSGAHRGAMGANPAGVDPCWAAPLALGAALGASSSSSRAAAWPVALGRGRWAYGACHEDLRALPWRMRALALALAGLSKPSASCFRAGSGAVCALAVGADISSDSEGKQVR